MKNIRGRLWIFGDDVNTDVIHPPQFFSLDPEHVKRGLFHGLDPSIQPALRPGDILVGGRNFGCGSSRETSMRSLKLNEVGAIVAIDFARIFFRNATNNGLPCLTFADPSDVARLRKGQSAEIVLADAELVLDNGERIGLVPPGKFVQQMWSAGGLLEMLPRSSGGST
jgi:3-isopropylmalate/(R)-2-methylmalate dehydratase small subunit